MPSTTDIIAALALAGTVIIGIFNYVHTNRLFQQSNYPKLMIHFRVTKVNPMGAFFTANIQNTHNSISVSETKTVFKVYGRLWMFTKIPAKFTAESLSGFLQPTDRRESRVLTHGSEAVVDINELIIKAFPDMFVVASDKTMQLKKPDGTPSDKEARIEQEYLKVVRTRELLVKLITTYRPNIHKSKIQKEVQRYIITPTYDPTDKYKEYTGWNVRQV